MSLFLKVALLAYLRSSSAASTEPNGPEPSPTCATTATTAHYALAAPCWLKRSLQPFI